ncbi:alkaline phosphatase family protein [Microbacterium telephonicum]|uniref:Putative AlkP superfamily pyrophosphatase or phosphodiesterase n=1 Tax=Microbacterium telephonicum TaxID=1714841 RepID=A0A498C1H8_9MICO|nr:alkaline phosphatase family protein [Microbacterium telephonicum]RLK49455.1 putative AlkP superfamily pyrophosphatase or phosphodiesterase [Microbacterium telephonicum]
MSLSLPVDPPTARSLTGVVTESLRSLGASSEWFAPARSAVVVLVDGLGRGNLTARSGHARFLVSAMAKRDAARSTFPTTTATALASLLTGTDAGRHGIVGYRLRVPGTERTPDQLGGYESDGLDPLTWQRSTPLLAEHTAAGRPAFVVSRARYRTTGFTTALQRGATFVAAETVAERLAVASALADAHDGALVYAYLPELDALGHKWGWESDRWLHGLEGLDRDVAAFAGALPPGVGALVTADHGMVDVPAHRHVLLGAGDPLLHGVRHVAGEPRMLHLYAEEGAADAVATAWRDAEGHRSWVLTRDEAIAAGLFGVVVDPEVAVRIGDVLVAARASIAYYDDRLADKRAQGMIGQHGSLTDQERIVPLIRLGAYATPR